MGDLIKKAAQDLIESCYAIALTGAGISTESGIPDFRGPSGVWTKNPRAEKKAYQSYQGFLADPKKWWEERLRGASLLGDIEKAKPNAGHYALVELETMGLLKCVITQNVDALHEKAGSVNVIEYHGSVLKLRCVDCGSRFKREEFDLERLRTEGALPPRCPKCRGVIKTDGVAFGEPIPNDVAHRSVDEARKCDLMLICGTSAVVYPFADLPRLARQRKDGVPETIIIEVNADPTPLTEEKISDYLIRGKTGEILPRLVETIRRIREC